MRSWQHYLGRCLDRWVVPHVPVQRRLAAKYYRHTLTGWEPEVRRIRQFAKAGVAVDVGANMGLWTYAMVKSGLFERVIAFEPNQALTLDLQSAGFTQVSIVHQALSAEAGSAILRTPRLNGMLLEGWASLEAQVDIAPDEFIEHTVATARLDDLALKGVGFIKIDVEGHEQRVLQGARHTLERCRPVCLIECREQSSAAVEAFLADLRVGYRRVDTQATHGFSLSGDNVLFATS